MTKGSTTWTYTYDANGMRTSRSNGTTTYSYVYNGGLLMQMTDGTNILYFTYDAGGTPLTVTLNGTLYYYMVNPQGDVTGIWSPTDGYVCDYYYDAWGKITRISTYVTSDLATLNPLRYRSYVFDSETGLYYLQSRYYNPTWGRFLNADSYTSTGQGMLGNNMFAYCNNNPISFCDPCGTCIHYWYLFGFLDCEKCKASKGNSISTSSDGDLSIDDFINPDGTISLYDNKRNNPSKKFHEQLFAFSTSPASFDIWSGDVSLGAVDATLITGGWEFDNVDLSLLDLGRAEAALGYEDGHAALGATASVWSPSVTFETAWCDISLGLNVISYGAKLEFGSKGFKADLGFGLWGFSIDLS